MRFVSFYDGARIRPGCIEDDRIGAIACASLIEYIALPSEARPRRHTAETFALRETRLAAPVHPHKNVFCVGRNYLEHAREGARALGRELKLPQVPAFFTKAPTAVADPDAQLRFSAQLSAEYDWEGELALIIGSQIKDCSIDRAPEAIFGYTCLNDITARNLQRAHGQWFKGKSLDQSCPLGPWIVTPESAGNPQDMALFVRVNGAVKQSANTRDMIFPIARIIAELSKGMTLEPGDVIATGTPEGVGFARTPPEFFADGDSVEVEIERIGTLRNSISIA